MIRWGHVERPLLVLLVAVLVSGSCMRSELTWRRKKAEKALHDATSSEGRFVDMSVALRVVVQDPNGAELIDGAPKMRVIREHRLGGTIDTKASPPCFVGPGVEPAVWYCSEDQETLVLHGDDLQDRLLVYGSEGAGKTEVLSMWAGLRALEFTGADREIGVTVPTQKRSEMFKRAAIKRWPRSWFRWVERDSCFYLANGVRVRLVSTHQQSAADGSRVQGYNWSAHAGDELQDQGSSVDGDIEMRGRSAPGGRYKRINSVTAKDDPDWRNFKARLLASGKWELKTLLGPRSPFIFPSVWEDRKATLTSREFQRRVLAMDVGPERMLYHTWDRAKNVRAIPRNAIDVTSSVLKRWGHNLTVLVGHDPGKLWHVSELLKAYETPGRPGFEWYVVDEVTTRQSTVEQHVQVLLERLQSKWRTNLLDWRGGRAGGNQAFVRADPYSDSSSDASPDRGVYKTFAKHGLQILAAAYHANVSKVSVGRVPKEARIDMVCRLLCNAAGERRLFVASDENGQPVAPRLVEAIETMERDVAGRAEMERKDDRDRSHWPASLGYALWELERPRLVEVA